MRNANRFVADRQAKALNALRSSARRECMAGIYVTVTVAEEQSISKAARKLWILERTHLRGLLNALLT